MCPRIAATVLPLSHRRVLVTRARGQASALAALLEQQGATPILLPAIEIAPPASWCALDAALITLRTFDWLIFTSANAVHAFTQRARRLQLSQLPTRVAVIGPATAQAVMDSGLAHQVALMPPQFIAEALAEALAPHCPGANMLLVRAAAARDVLPDRLRAAGAHLTIAEAYRNVVPQDSIAALPKLFSPHLDSRPDAITFTSASAAHNLSTLLDSAGVLLPAEVVLASIGPITSAAMRTLRLEPTVEAHESTVEGLVGALAAHFSQSVRT